jgi:lysophospholipase L1-like esterase
VRRLVGLAACALAVALAASASAAPTKGRCAPAADRVVYLAGDSITYGYGVLETRERDSYPARARDLLCGHRCGRVEVRGLGGRCLVFTECITQPTMVASFEELVLTADPLPSAVIVQAGLNDLNHITDRDYRRAYRQLRRMGHQAGVRVLIGTITPLGAHPAPFPREWVEPQRVRVNRWIRRAIPRHDVVDFAKALEGPGRVLRPEFDSGDGLHPGALGALRMADATRGHRLGRPSRRCR